MASAGGFLADVNDPWLKPRLLRAVVAERLPQPGGAELPPAEVASVLEAVRTHGLLTEVLPDHPPDPKLAEAWRAAVDAWVERVDALVESDSTYSCWLGTCFLGVTFQECSNERFAKSYSNWFEKILSNLQQEPSSLQLVTTVSCTSMSDLFVRLAKFLSLKKEASSFAGRVVEPVLRLLNETGPVADEAVDLLRTVIKLYPSSVNRHYNKVESAIAAKVMSTEVSVKPCEKFARALALLPSVRVSEDSWSLMIRKVLIVVNNLLNDAFIGLEEDKKGHDIMLLLVPPGTDPPPTLGDQASQLLPHGASIIRLITEYLQIAKLPTLRTKVYSIVQLLLTSMGVGMSLHLLDATVSNVVADLNGGDGNGMSIVCTNPSEVTSESSSKSYSKKRKQEPQIQNSVVSASEKAGISPWKRKSSSMPIASKKMTPETTGDVRMLTPLSVKIAAVETLEILLNVGGSLRTDHWRSEVDLLLINVATSVCDTGGSYEQKPFTVGEPSISDLQLASLKALLASFLSSPHARTPYLAKGIELFRRGKLEIGTKLAEFCWRALLALDVLMHPRALSLERAAPLGPGLNYGAPEKAVFGAGKYMFSPSRDHYQAMEVEDMYDDWLVSNKDDESAEAPVNDTAVMTLEDERQLNPITEDPKIDPSRIADAVQYVVASSKSDVKMVDATADELVMPNTMDNPSSSNAVSTPGHTTNSDSQNHMIASFPEQKRIDHVSHLENKSSVIDAPFRKLGTSDEASVVPDVASSSHQAPGGSSTSFAELFGSESDVESESEDSMPDIKDGDPDSD
ncbi:uncharacterized protein LOC133918828 isoform X3 [Phragmites australis]|uniref:uncharacterized protein LOC133918828 isoform X3 n=1 Tax=Phragmites australis TaxID=29695 RepID=UPI002D7A3A45|nr:uncharacterized protein LOC133918828 isoform X3 [Phragmites australis]